MEAFLFHNSLCTNNKMEDEYKWPYLSLADSIHPTPHSWTRIAHKSSSCEKFICLQPQSLLSSESIEYRSL